MVKNSPFVAAPAWCDQEIFWTISGQAVDHNLWREITDASDDQIYILFLSQDMPRMFFEINCQIRSF